MNMLTLQVGNGCKPTSAAFTASAALPRMAVTSAALVTEAIQRLLYLFNSTNKRLCLNVSSVEGLACAVSLDGHGRALSCAGR